jgi:hypothetical protein
VSFPYSLELRFADLVYKLYGVTNLEDTP